VTKNSQNAIMKKGNKYITTYTECLTLFDLFAIDFGKCPSLCTKYMVTNKHCL